MAWTLPEHHRATAERIPAAIKAQLQPHELLARCERYAELTKTGDAMQDRAALLSYLELAEKTLTAMTPAQLAADLAVLNKGLTAAPHGLAGSYASARAQLEADNPQPTAEQLAKAAAVVRAADVVGASGHWQPSVVAGHRTWVRDRPQVNRAVSADPTMLYK